MARLGSIPLPKINGGSAAFQRDIASQNRRITGVTPSLTKSFQNKPYRYLRKAGAGAGLQNLAKGAF
jgi:hypothetical protein